MSCGILKGFIMTGYEEFYCFGYIIDGSLVIFCDLAVYVSAKQIWIRIFGVNFYCFINCIKCLFVFSKTFFIIKCINELKHPVHSLLLIHDFGISFLAFLRSAAEIALNCLKVFGQ